MTEYERREIERRCALNMDGFEHLAAPVRAAVRASVIGLPVDTVLRARLAGIRTGLPAAEADEVLPLLIAGMDEDEVRAESERSMRRCGRPSPHVAAAASILRPDEKVQHARRR